MNNIYRVIDESHILEILENNPYKFVVVTFTSKQSDFNKKIYKRLISLAKEHTDAIFIYIDVEDYKYIGRIKVNKITSTMIFLKGTRLSAIDGSDPAAIVLGFNQLLSRKNDLVNDKPQEVMQQQISIDKNVSAPQQTIQQEYIPPHDNFSHRQMMQKEQFDNALKMKQFYEQRKAQMSPQIQNQIQQLQKETIDENNISNLIDKIDTVCKIKKEQEKLIN